MLNRVCALLIIGIFVKRQIIYLSKTLALHVITIIAYYYLSVRGVLEVQRDRVFRL